MATTDIRNGDIGPHYTGEWVSDCQQLHVQYQTNTVHLSLSLSHSRSGGRVTAPIDSRKDHMRRGSVELLKLVDDRARACDG